MIWCLTTLIPKNESFIKKFIRKIINACLCGWRLDIVTSKILNRICKNIKKSSLCSNLMFADNYNYKAHLLSVNDMNDIMDIEFEGYKFMCIRKYDYLLKNLYGDYMLLPKLSEQVSNHNFRAMMRK